jgi:hypothetical protein
MTALERKENKNLVSELKFTEINLNDVEIISAFMKKNYIKKLDLSNNPNLIFGSIIRSNSSLGESIWGIFNVEVIIIIWRNG